MHFNSYLWLNTLGKPQKKIWMALHQTDPIATLGTREGGWSDSLGKISFSVVFQFFYIYGYKKHVSVCSGYYNSTIALVTHRTVEMYWSQCRRLSEQIQCLVRVYLLFHSCLFLITLYGRRGKGSLWGLFYKGTKPICGGASLTWPSHFPKAPPPNIIILEVGLQ